MSWSAGKISTIIQKPAPAIGLSTPPIGCVLDLSGLPGAGNKIYDRSPYGNIGTITGAVWKVLPSGLWVLDFDGVDDYVNCGSASNLVIGTKNFTIEVWAYAATNPSYPTGIVICKGSTGAGEWMLRDNTSLFEFYANGASWFTDGASKDGKLHYFVVTRSDDTAYFYVDVANVASKSDVGSIDLNTALACYVGAYGTIREWKGYIGLPRLYIGRALSALEIQNHYQQEKHLFGAC